MAPSPVALILVIVAVFTFTGLLFSTEVEEQAVPLFEHREPEPVTEEDCDGWFDATVCSIGVMVDAFTGFLGTIWLVIQFLFDVVTFNVPGAPWYLRVLVGTGFGFAIVWSAVTLFRGN